jgi:hypothetical protein
MGAAIARLAPTPTDPYAYMAARDPITGASLCVTRPGAGANLVVVERGLNGKVLWAPDVIATRCPSGWRSKILDDKAVALLAARTAECEFNDRARAYQ